MAQINRCKSRHITYLKNCPNQIVPTAFGRETKKDSTWHNHPVATMPVVLVLCVCVMPGWRLCHAQWEDFLRPESRPAQNVTTSTNMVSATPATPAQPVVPSSQNYIADDWYRFETANLEPFLTPREQHYMNRLIELGLTDLAEFYCRKQIKPYSVPLPQEAGYMRAMFQAKKQKLCNALPRNRSIIWEQIEQLCAESDTRFAGSPYAPAVLLQQIDIQLTYAELLTNDAVVGDVATGDVLPQIAERILGTLALIDAELEHISQHIASQPASPATSRETVMQMMFGQLFRFHKAVAMRLLACCQSEQKSELPRYSGQPTSAQALSILRAMSDPRQGELTVFAAFEAIACLRLTQQYDEAASLVGRLRNNDFVTPCQRLQLTAVDLVLAVDMRDESRVHTALQAVETALQQLPPQQAAAGMPELLLAQFQAYLFFWKRNIETQSSTPHIVGTTTAPNIDECRSRVYGVMQRLEHDCAPYWHQRAGLAMQAESRFIGNDPMFLEQRADALAREGRIDEAVERFDRLAAAVSTTNPAESFRIAKKAADFSAADAEANHHVQAVIDRYRTLAVTHSKFADAIDVHLAAVYYAARRLRDGDESGLNDYLSLLREHFLTWPHSKQADPLRVQTAQLLMHELKYRDAVDTLAPLTNRSPVALDAIQAADACFDILRLAQPDVNASLEKEAVSWFYRRLLNADGAVIADWNDADGQSLLCMVKYSLLYAGVIEYNKASNPDVNLRAVYQPVEKMLQIGLANYQQASPEWRAAADSMLLYVLAAQDRMNDAGQILQTMRQWNATTLMAALDRLQQLADVSSAGNRHTLGEMRLDIAQILEQHFQASQQNAEIPINLHQLEIIRADALADIGKPQEAVDLLGRLLRQSPDDIGLLTPLARILERQPDAPSHETALKLWRSVEQRSPKYSEAWWDAKEAVIHLLIATGRRQEAESMFQMMQILHPELGGADRKLRFESITKQP